MTVSFLKPNDPRLGQITPPIPLEAITSAAVKEDLDHMYAVARPEQSDRSRPILVGVAASQLGIARRIMLVDIAADGHGVSGDLRAYLNPVIVEHSTETAEWYEGCYSTAPACGIVARPTRITVEAYSPEGQRITEHLEGYVARIFQHEIDHLDGKVFIDHITDPDKLHWVEADDYPRYRDQEGWRHWPKKFPRARWDELRQKIQ